MLSVSTKSRKLSSDHGVLVVTKDYMEGKQGHIYICREKGCKDASRALGEYIAAMLPTLEFIQK